MSPNRWLAALCACVCVGCMGGGASRPRTPSSTPPASAATAISTHVLYEAGRFEEVVGRTSSAPLETMASEDLWFAAHSYLDLRRPAEARGLFDRLAATGDASWRAAASLALAVMGGNAAEIDAARTAAGPYSGSAFVVYELGMAHLARGAIDEAAAALDRSAALSPTLAHAYYYAGLAYQKLNRLDVMANRFETFLRLAPEAPQRPEVEAVMRSIRG